MLYQLDWIISQMDLIGNRIRMRHWKELLLDHIKAIETYQGVESPDSISQKTGISIDQIIKLNEMKIHMGSAI